jgi:hypothetical protein
MKNIKNCLVVLILFTIFACEHKPEFYIDGKPYYTRYRCVESTSERVYDYHYGYHFGTYKMGWGWRTERTCIESTRDTIAIKIKK